MTTTTQPTLQGALQTLVDLDRDRASIQNGHGFNAYDTEFARKLAATPTERWSPRQQRAVYALIRKYRAQLGDMGIDFAAITEPPIVTDEVAAEWDTLRARQTGRTTPVARRDMVMPNPSTAFIEINFTFDRKLVAELKLRLGGTGRLRWIDDKQQGRKYWRYSLPPTPEECRALLSFAKENAFTIQPELRARIEDGAAAGDRRRAASRAVSTDWPGPKLLRTLYPFQLAGVRYILEAMGCVIERTDDANRGIYQDTASESGSGAQSGERQGAASERQSGGEASGDRQRSGVERERVAGDQSTDARSGDQGTSHGGIADGAGERGQLSGRQQSSANRLHSEDGAGIDPVGVRSGVPDQDKGTRHGSRSPATLQSGLRQSADTNGPGIRRGVPPEHAATKARSAEDEGAHGAWVVCKPDRPLGGVMLADSMGLGKSIQTIASIEALDGYPCLMVTKATTIYQMQDEWTMTVPDLKPEDVYVIGASRVDARAFYQAKIVIVAWSRVTTLRDTLIERGFKGLIVDESHRAKSYGAQRTEAIKAIATGKRAKKNEDGKIIKTSTGRKGYETINGGCTYRICATGTPVVNRPGELIPQLEIIGRLEDLGGFQQFRSRYCPTDTYGHIDNATEIDGRRLATLNEQLRGICYVARMKPDVAPELPPVQRTIVPVRLAPAFRKEYQEARRDIIRFVGGRAERDREFRASIADLSAEEQAAALRKHRGEAEERAQRAETMVRINHLKQIAGHGKIEAAKEWIADFLEEGQKLIVFCRHVAVQHALMAEYPDAVHIFGSDTAQERDEAKKAFQNDPTVPIIVCATEAASEGVTLTAASHVLFVELEWTPAAHDQAEARCYGRINDMHGASAYYLLAQDTIDQQIWRLLDKKRIVCAAISDGGARAAALGESIMDELLAELSEGVTQG